MSEKVAIIPFVMIIVALVTCIVSSINNAKHTINDDGSLNPIEIDAVVLFHNSRWNIKTVQYCGHRYIMTKNALIHDPDCPCYEVRDDHHEY